MSALHTNCLYISCRLSQNTDAVLVTALLELGVSVHMAYNEAARCTSFKCFKS